MGLIGKTSINCPSGVDRPTDEEAEIQPSDIVALEFSFPLSSRSSLPSNVDGRKVIDTLTQQLVRFRSGVQPNNRLGTVSFTRKKKSMIEIFRRAGENVFE